MELAFTPLDDMLSLNEDLIRKVHSYELGSKLETCYGKKVHIFDRVEIGTTGPVKKDRL